MNYATLIATIIVQATGLPASMMPVVTNAVLDASAPSGINKKNLFREVPPAEAQQMLDEALADKEGIVALLDSWQPAGAPSLAAQGKMLSQLQQAHGVLPMPKAPAPLNWSPLRMFKGKRG